MFNQNNIGLPIFFNVRGEDDSTNLVEDRYQVFVEGQYVGDKTLYTQAEDTNDVADFLKKEGFENAEIELDGDHIIVHSENHQEAMKMRQVLEVFLKNR